MGRAGGSMVGKTIMVKSLSLVQQASRHLVFALAGLAASGLIHLLVASLHGQESVVHVVAFTLAGVGQLVALPVLLFWQRRTLYWWGLLLTTALIFAYLVALVLPLPFATHHTAPERLDLIGGLNLLAELLSLYAFTRLLQEAPAADPYGQSRPGPSLRRGVVLGVLLAAGTLAAGYRLQGFALMRYFYLTATNIYYTQLSGLQPVHWADQAIRSRVPSRPPSAEPVTLELAPPTDDLQVHEISISTAPVDVPSYSYRWQVKQLPDRVYIVPEDIWIVGARKQEIDATGQPLPRSHVIHHDTWINTSRESPKCAVLHDGILSWGHGLDALTWPAGYGYFIPAGTKLIRDTLLVNESSVSYSGFQIITTFYYVVKPTNGLKLKDTVIVRNSVGPCDPGYILTWPYTSETYTNDIVAPLSGRVVILVSHGHDYTDYVTLTDVTKNQVLWTALPEVTPGPDQHNYTYMPSQTLPPDSKMYISKGDILRVSTHFTNNDQVLGESIGQMYLYVSPEDAP